MISTLSVFKALSYFGANSVKFPVNNFACCWDCAVHGKCNTFLWFSCMISSCGSVSGQLLMS